ncbi:Ig-like domain-containing protein [Myxococcus sp. CA040A]|uniref:Ig-like domain-containing protein n=1 Tax=Myxococcus sp. CA040A TaxID=2741738 RepID=UPI001C2DADFE|nr:Ig-like domain-containing protein [Myxococcus sp. CA040A]NTX07312.1 Ig-like domain-containing protein [Myxococcus sp. CA040A]
MSKGLVGAVVCGWLLAACGGNGNGLPDGSTPTDSGTHTERDSGTPEQKDAGPTDAGPTDAGLGDAGPLEDTSPPDAPMLIGTAPASPANANVPHILARTEPGARVRLFTVAGCSGVIAGEGTADAEGHVSIPVSVLDDAWASFHGLAIDRAGNVSACSPQGVTYREDSTPPALSGLRLSPSETANDNTPRLIGSTESGATVRLYFDGTCSGTPIDSQVADAAGTFSVRMSVPDDTVTATYVTTSDAAGNSSACTVGPSYREDSTPPATPALATTPVAPANHNVPVLQVTTEPGAAVRFFAGTTCLGEEFASRAADNQGQVSLSLSVADNSTSTYVAQATDAVGNVSACSAALTFVEDSTAPSELAATVMDGLAGAELEYQNSNTRVAARWSGFTDSVGIRRYELAVTSTAGCPGNASSIQDVGATSSAELTVLTLAEQRYSSCVRAVDAAGNTSGWKMSNGFIVDVTPPRVVSATPAASSVTASPWTAIEVSFSETTLDTASVTPTSFHVTANGMELSGGAVSCAAGKCTLALTLTQRPAFGAQVSVALNGVKDLAGNAMTPSHAWDYSVRAAQWGAPLLISSNSNRKVPSPVLTMDSAGVATVLYANEGLRARRHKPGAAWEADQVVGTGTIDTSLPKPGALTTLSNGTPLAVVEALPTGDFSARRAYGILATGSDSAVQSWSVPRLLGANTGLKVMAPRVMTAPNQGALAAWVEENSTQSFLWVQPYAGSSGWGTPVLVRTLDDSNWDYSVDGYDVGVDSRGNGVLAWSDINGPLQYSRQGAGGWSVPARGESIGGRYPQMALNPDGTGLAVWIRWHLDNYRLYANSFSLNSGFSDEEVPLHSQGSVNGEPRVGADANGNAFVVWSQNGPGSEWGLWCARYVKGSGWQPLQQLATDYGGGKALHVSPSGTATVVYGRTEGSVTAVWARRFVPGSGWSSAQRLDVATVKGYLGNIEVATSPLGNAVVVWPRQDLDAGTDTLLSAVFE